MSQADDVFDPLTRDCMRVLDRDWSCRDCRTPLPRGSTTYIAAHRKGRVADRQGRTGTGMTLVAFCEPCWLARSSHEPRGVA